jgi:hypothetical protein
VRHAEQDRQRTRLVEYGDLGAAAWNFDTAFHKHIYAAGALALFQYDGSACHMFPRRTAPQWSRMARISPFLPFPENSPRDGFCLPALIESKRGAMKREQFIPNLSD